MSDKKLLAENTVRRFMKLANVDTLTDNFVAEAYKKEEDQMEEAAETTEDVVEEELELYEQEGDDEEEMPEEEEGPEDEMPEDEPPEELDMDDETMGEADISLTEEEAQLLIDLGERLKEAIGADMGDAGEDMEGMKDMKDMEELGDMADDEPGVDDEEEELMQEDIVNEVLKRVTQRIIREKMARK